MNPITLVDFFSLNGYNYSMTCEHEYRFNKDLPALSWQCNKCNDITTSISKAIPNLMQWMRTL